MELTSILAKAEKGEQLSREDAVALLHTDNTSSSFYQLIAAANERSRRVFGNKGYIFAQIGLNAYPCSGNCSFCSLAEKHFVVGEHYEKSCEEVVAQVKEMETDRIEALFLMTTADFSQQKFLEIGRAVRGVLDKKVHLVANIGDFDEKMAVQLKEAGFDTGAASYTGNLSGNLVARGWRRVSNNGRPCKGDVLLNDRSHVAAWLGDCLAQASIDERGRISGGKAGDQGAPNGRGETNTRGYYDYPWDCYLRWTGASVPVAPLGNAATRQAQRWLVGMGWSVGASGVDGSNGPDTHRALAKCLQATLNKYGAGLAVDGSYGPKTRAAVNKYGPVCGTCLRRALVQIVQVALLAAGHGVGGSGVDGSCGPDTQAAIRAFQHACGLAVDGLAGPDTCAKLFQ